MDAASPSSTPVPSPVPLPAFGTIPVGGMSRALDLAFDQDNTPLKKTKIETLELAMANMATMMEQQSLHMSNMMKVSMNASMAAQQSSEHMMKLLIQQLGLREAAGVLVGGLPAVSQVVQAAPPASSMSVTASVEVELDEDVQTFVHKMASSFEKLVKKYVQAKRNLKIDEDELEVLHDSTSMRYPPGIRPFKSPLENVELDKLYSKAAVADFEFKVMLRAGSSRRESMALIHHASAVIFREINCEAVRDHVQHLQPMVTREAYFQSLKEYAPVIPDSLDLEEPPRPPFNLRKAMDMSEKLYAQIVDRIRAKKQKEKYLKEEEDKAKKTRGRSGQWKT